VRPSPDTWALRAGAEGASWVPLSVAGSALLPGLEAAAGLPFGLGALGLSLQRSRDAVEADVGVAGRLAAGTAALALAAAGAAVLLGPGASLPGEARGVAAAGAAAALATILAREAAEADDHRVRRAAHALAGSLHRNVLVAAGLAGLVVARLNLEGRLAYLTLYEWGLAVILASLALERVVDWYRDEAPDASWDSPHARHEQEVARLAGDPVHRIDEAGRAFLEGETDAEAYADAWEPVRRRLDDPALEDALADLRAHEDRPEPRLLRLPGRVEAAREENRRTRRSLHDRLVDALDEGGSPP
jgi:hypothetical protein